MCFEYLLSSVWEIWMLRIQICISVQVWQIRMCIILICISAQVCEIWMCIILISCYSFWSVSLTKVKICITSDKAFRTLHLKLLGDDLDKKITITTYLQIITTLCIILISTSKLYISKLLVMFYTSHIWLDMFYISKLLYTCMRFYISEIVIHVFYTFEKSTRE
jgi:hypothetical protein